MSHNPYPMSYNPHVLLVGPHSWSDHNGKDFEVLARIGMQEKSCVIMTDVNGKPALGFYDSFGAPTLLDSSAIVLARKVRFPFEVMSDKEILCRLHAATLGLDYSNVRIASYCRETEEAVWHYSIKPHAPYIGPQPPEPDMLKSVLANPLDAAEALTSKYRVATTCSPLNEQSLWTATSEYFHGIVGVSESRSLAIFQLLIVASIRLNPHRLASPDEVQSWLRWDLPIMEI